MRRDEEEISSVKTNEAIVFSALELAYDLRGGPVTAEDVQIVGLNFELRGESQSESMYGWWTCGWGPFDYRDRTRKHLERLVRKGFVVKQVSAGGHGFRYAPASVAPLGRAEALQKLLSARELASLLAAPTVGGLTTAKEFNRFLDSEVEDLLDVQDLDERAQVGLRYIVRATKVEEVAKKVKDIEEREGVEAARQFIEEQILSKDGVKRWKKRKDL